MAVIDGFKVEEVIKDFTFREIGGIKILKEWRELAVICQVDIEIVSVSKENYRNYGSIPAHGFYGYVSLVMRDFVSQPIKIQQARQSLYYARNDSAISNWFTYLQQVRVQENYKAIENLICFNTVLLGGACVPVPCKDIPEFSFDEFPLREVMVKTSYGTQFKIEYSFWKLNNELSACGDIITPKSKQIDGDKDNGLPPNGSSPQNGNPNNPYQNLPPADGTDKAGVLSLDKLNNQDNPNPENNANKFHVIQYVRDYINGCGNGLYEASYLTAIPYDSIPIYNYQNVVPSQTCGQAAQNVNIFVNGVQYGGSSGLADMYLSLHAFPVGFPTDGLTYGWRRIQ